MRECSGTTQWPSASEAGAIKHRGVVSSGNGRKLLRTTTVGKAASINQLPLKTNVCLHKPQLWMTFSKLVSKFGGELLIQPLQP